MTAEAVVAVREQVGRIFQAESRRVYASLIRLLGDMERAEEALQDAFAAALERWPREGMPQNPRAWLVSAGRFKAIDAARRKAKHDDVLRTLARSTPEGVVEEVADVDWIPDDRLRLIFTCCHPALALEVQIALTLREVCGLATERIASLFLTSTATVAQRIVRGKAKIRTAGIPYEVPTGAEREGRLDAVLAVAYLLFKEGYAPSEGPTPTDPQLADEAVRLARLLVELAPESETHGLLALMLLQDSRRRARATADGELILLEDQDRTLWDRARIAEGAQYAAQALSTGAGPYALQAGIAAEHALAPRASDTAWGRIVELYDRLFALTRSPVVELNRAVAVAMRDGPAAGLALVDAILERGDLADFHLAHAAQADFRRRLGDAAGAAEAYRRALESAKQESERRFLKMRLAELS